MELNAFGVNPSVVPSECNSPHFKFASVASTDCSTEGRETAQVQQTDAPSGFGYVTSE
jgi:hypothetical protein